MPNLRQFGKINVLNDDSALDGNRGNQKDKNLVNERISDADVYQIQKDNQNHQIEQDPPPQTDPKLYVSFHDDFFEVE